jgi:N-acyl homoserine lactone hydrolase
MKREIYRKLFLLMVPLVFLGLTSPTQAAEVEVYAFKAGLLKTETQHILKDTRIGTPMDIPIPFLMIRHGKEWIAFDTGCNAEAARDPVGYLGEEAAKAFSPVIGPSQEFQRAIKILGLKPADLKAVVISHGHFDHAGAIEDFLGTNVPIYFQKAELAEIRKIVESQQMRTAYIPVDFKHLKQLNIQEIEGPFDIFGDKSVIVFPTPGHTRGHQSLYVKPTEGKAFIYTADALYTLENMEKSIPPPPALVADLSLFMQTINWFKLEEWTGVTIVPSHDPEYWAKRAWAPAELVP